MTIKWNPVHSDRIIDVKPILEGIKRFIKAVEKTK